MRNLFSPLLPRVTPRAVRDSEDAAMTLKWPHLALALALWVCAGLSPAGAQQVAPPAPVEPGFVNLEALLTPPATDDEKALAALVQSAQKGGEKGGREVLKGKKVLNLSARAAAVLALNKNLSIQLAAHDHAIQEAVVLEAEAAFLPVFDVSVNYLYDKVFTRKRDGLVTRKFIPPRNDLDIPAPSKIKQIRFMPFQAPGVIPGTQFAATHLDNTFDTRTTLTTSISQLLPWGASLQLSLSPSHRQVPYDGHNHDFDQPWGSTITASLVLPVPFAKNFGPYAPADVAIKVARFNRDASLWNLKGVMNSTLSSVDQAYWDLVTALQLVDSTRRNRETVEKLRTETGDLFKGSRITQYAVDQVEAEFLRVEGAEEAAWNNYIAASDVLVEVLDFEPDTVFIPTGYSKLLGERLAYKAEEAVPTALANRPELRSQETIVKAAKAAVRGRETEAKPDVSLTASGAWSLRQDVIGMKTLPSAVARNFGGHNDERDQAYGGVFRRSLFNRAEYARLDEARSQQEVEELSLRIVENEVAWEVNSALSNVAFSKSILAAAKEQLAASSNTYDLAQKDLHETQKITAFEVITKNQDVLNAQNGVVIAQTNLKKAETQLAAAEGTLASLYPEMTATGEFDRYRISLLKARRALHFFGEVKKDERSKTR